MGCHVLDFACVSYCMLPILLCASSSARVALAGMDKNGILYMNGSSDTESFRMNGIDVAAALDRIEALFDSTLVSAASVRQQAENAKAASASIPSAIQDTSAAIVNLSEAVSAFRSEIYFIGGYDGTRSKQVLSFNGKTWIERPGTVTGRSGHAAVVYQDKIYVMGGQPSSRDVECFDGETWSSAPQLTTGRINSAAVVYDSKIYVIAGSGDSAGVETYDGTGGWVKHSARLNQARIELAAAVYQGKIYAIGGNSGGELTSVEAFDGSSWQAVDSLTYARRDCAAAVFRGHLYACGGDSTHPDSCEMFDGSTWSAGPAMPAARWEYALVVYNDMMYAMGGKSTVYFSYDGDAWRNVAGFNRMSWNNAAAVF